MGMSHILDCGGAQWVLLQGFLISLFWLFACTWPQASSLVGVHLCMQLCKVFMAVRHYLSNMELNTKLLAGDLALKELFIYFLIFYKKI